MIYFIADIEDIPYCQILTGIMKLLEMMSKTVDMRQLH